MSGRDKDDSGKGFKVTDRRIFGEDGDEKPEDGQTADSGESSPAVVDTPPEATAAPKDTVFSGPLPPVDFQTFVISLGSSALMHLGAIEHPETGKAELNLDLAKHTIEVLVMLEKKTSGNLSSPESQLLTSLLYDLRLKFVEAARK